MILFKTSLEGLFFPRISLTSNFQELSSLTPEQPLPKPLPEIIIKEALILHQIYRFKGGVKSWDRRGEGFINLSVGIV